MIKSLNKENFASAKTEISIPNGGTDLKLFVREIGYLELQNLAGAPGGNMIAAIVCASVSDADGNTFTMDEVLKLKKSVAEPLFKAVIEVNGLDNKEVQGDSKN